MRRITGFKKRTYVLLGVLSAVAAMAAVGAYAYWTSSGTGSGSASTGTSTAWQVTSDVGSVANALTPGGPSETVSWHVKNNNSGVQNLQNVNVQIATTVTGPPDTPGVWTVSGGSTPDCNKNDFQLSADGTTWAAAGAAVDDTESAGDVASNATASGTIQIRMINKPSSGGAANNQDNCKSVTVPLFLAAS